MSIVSRHNIRFAATSLLVALLCAGCAAGQDNLKAGDVTPAPDAGSTAAPDSEVDETPDSPSGTEASGGARTGTTYSTLAELKQAVESAGVDCSTWRLNEDEGTVAGSETGWCGAYEWGISVYDDGAAVDAVVESSDTSLEPQAFLVGPNWLVTRGYEDPADLVTVQAGIGGTIWYPGDPYPHS